MKKILNYLIVAFHTAMLDAEALFSNDQAITATATSTNIFDQGNEGGDGSDRTIAIHVTETFATLTSLTIDLQDCDTVGGTYADVIGLPAITLAGGGLAAGQVHELPVPKGTREFLQLNYTVGGSNATAGKIKAGIVLAVDSPTIY